jgi:oligogalacturonide transporter
MGYACGDIFGGGGFLIVNLLVFNYFVIVEGLDVVRASMIIFICKLWDGVTDPIMGFISDRTRNRFGRRRIYFLAGAPVVFVSVFLMWNSFGITDSQALWVYHLLTYMLFDTAFTIVMVPYNSILSDMTTDYNERTRFTSVRMIFSASSTLVCAVVPSLLISAVGSPVNGPGQKPGYAVMAAIFGAIFGIVWILTFFGTWENPQFAHKPVERTGLRDWANIFRNKSYRSFLGLFIFVQVSIDLLLALFVFFVDIVLMKFELYSLLMGILLVSGIAYMAIFGKLAQVKGKRFPLFVSIPIFIVVCLFMLTFTPSTPVFILCIIALFISVQTSAGNVCTWSMLSDLYDVGELITSRRSEGIYAGFTTFVYKLSSGIAILIIGIGLQRAGFNQNEYNLLKSMGAIDFAGYANSSIVWAIKGMMVFIPVVFQLLALLFAARYKLSNKRFDTVRSAIARFKAEGAGAVFSQEERDDLKVVTGLEAEKLWGRI